MITPIWLNLIPAYKVYAFKECIQSVCTLCPVSPVSSVCSVPLQICWRAADRPSRTRTPSTADRDVLTVASTSTEDRYDRAAGALPASSSLYAHLVLYFPLPSNSYHNPPLLLSTPPYRFPNTPNISHLTGLECLALLL